jgi:ParB-like chromosome segregation protein Spo0J
MVEIASVKVTDRHRVELGDVSELAASIAMDGLMHPIVITTDCRLIAGHRRIEACKSLGWTEIQATVIEQVTDAAQLLRMERDENTCRKDMTPSEKISLGRALEELERPKARERQGTRTDLGRELSVRPNETNNLRDSRRRAYDVREDVAPAVGLSTASYSRAKQLVVAAENGDPVAAEQVKEMDRTGKVTAPYEKWKGHKVNRGDEAKSKRDAFGLASEQPIEPEPKKKPSNVKNYKGRAPVDAMENAVATLSGITMPMRMLTADDLAGAPDEVRTRWIKELAEVLSTLRRVRDLIKENS